MKKISFLLSFLLFINCDSPSLNEKKSFFPGKKWLDNNGVHINAHGGGILFYQGMYYWYGEHKIEGEIGNTAQVGIHLYTSKDLYDWKDEGIVLKVDETNPESDIYKGSIIERPKVIFNKKTKKFVMWFHLEPINKVYKTAEGANVGYGAPMEIEAER